MKGDITKLPKWAQNEIKRLQASESHYKEKLREGPEDSNVFADPYSESKRPLGKNTTVSFEFGENFSDRIVARIEGPYLEISGGDALEIQARASNSIKLRLGTWW